LQEKIGWLTK